MEANHLWIAIRRFTLKLIATFINLAEKLSDHNAINSDYGMSAKPIFKLPSENLLLPRLPPYWRVNFMAYNNIL